MILDKADKKDVLDTLNKAMGYCNSHHNPAQNQFESIVDTSITPDSCIYDFEKRRQEMKSLFPVLLTSQLKGLIPSIQIEKGQLELEPSAFLKLWFSKWVAKYVQGWKTLPSQRQAKPKQAATDESLIQMVAAHAGSEEKAREWAKYHNLFMSAENIGGNLLEEYVAKRILPLGWIWCRGEVLTSVDFCNKDCTQFIQVKNKSNTENSSSKGFREGRKAPMWYRMEATRKRGRIVTRWPELVKLIKSGTGSETPVGDDLLSEEGYLEFIRTVSHSNCFLITSEEKGLVSVSTIIFN